MLERAGRMKRLFNKDVPFIAYIIHDKNMKNGRTVTVYKPTQEYYILFELIKFRRLPSTFPDIGITVISEGLEPLPSDVSVTQDVLMDIKKDLSDAEIEELGAQEAERKEFCPNCEAETPCTHEAELFVCDICGEDFAKYIVSRNCNVSDVSITQDVLTSVKTPRSIENTHPDYYKDDVGKWIPIASGRLPEKFQECIVLDKNNRVHNWIHDDVLLPIFAQYTHWMPLPKPPEVQE